MKLQKLTNKLFFFLILFCHTLYGCGLCTIYSPKTQVSIKVEANNQKIKTAEVTWVLTKEFTDQLKEIYDGNQNSVLDKDELKLIEQSLLDYVVPKNYLTHISYGKTINKDKTKKVIIKSEKVFIKNSILHFNYIINLDYNLVKGNSLYFEINDVNEYFILYVNELMVNFNSPLDYEETVGLNSVTFYITPDISEKIEKVESENIVKTEKVEIKKLVEIDNNENETLLSKFTKYIKEYLLKIQKGDNFALLMLLFISFVYGIIHALGPGHGKSLAFTYFTSNKTSYLKAFWISQASAFIHIVGALILVLISIFLLQSVLNNFVNDSVEILTKLSSALIMLLAIYILYNKLKNNSCACKACCSPVLSSEVNTNSTWSVAKPVTTKNIKTEEKRFIKKDLYFVLTAGLIPCPGTVILFIYAFILKTYIAVLLASIFISLGMGLVIFMASSLGIGIHKFSERSHKFTNILEILSPIIMFLLGLLLFFNANLI